MSNDALERLKKRQKPSVPPRDASLNSRHLDISTPEYLNASSTSIETSRSLDTSISETLNQTESSTNLDTSTSRHQERLEVQSPELEAQSSQPLETKQSTIRLERELSQRLSEICKTNGISREVLIEALFLHFEKESQVQQTILTEAKKRAESRMQLANFRRAKSMMKRFY